jgi:arylamine N-acetyltransferase
MSEIDVYRYLARLGLSDPGPPSVDGLRLLHRAQVERIPYENLDIQLGRLTAIDPVSSFRQVSAGRGGYCFHLNGAFALLLSALGYVVRWHRGGVQGRADPQPVGAIGNHLALTVHGLPDPSNPEGMWFVDAGLGDGLHEPLPLRAGHYRDGPFQFALVPSSREFLGWRFEHDPAGSFTGMDFRADVAGVADFQARHQWLSTSPDSGFVRAACVQRRDATGADVLRGRVLTRVPSGRSVELTTPADYFAALADVFGLVVPEDDRAPLWHRISAAHEAWASR